MDLDPDFSELLSTFNDAAVNYLIVGGHAVSIHDQPRFTKDLDIWIEPSRENAERTFGALARFGAPMGALTIDDLMDEDVVFQVGVEPLRVDIMSCISGVAFSDAWPDRLQTTYGGIPVAVIGKEALIQNKQATARPQDLLDVQNLRGRRNEKS